MQKTIEKENYLKAVYKMAEKSQKVSITITAIVSGYLLKRTWGKIRAKVL